MKHKIITSFIALLLGLCAANSSNIPNVQIRTTDYTYIIDFRMFNLINVLDTIENNIFSTLSIDSTTYDSDEYPGRPEIPFIAIDLQIPDKSTIKRVEVKGIQHKIKEIQYPIMPSQNISEDETTFVYDMAYYKQSVSFDTVRPYKISPPYTFMGTTGINIQLKPISYDPLKNLVRYTTNMRIVITLDSTATLTDMIEQTIHHDKFNDAPSYYDTYNDISWEKDPDYKGDYMIMYDDMYHNTIQQFANYKKNTGYNIQCYNTSDIGRSATKIRDFLHNKYASGTLPRFLLLVGDIAQIPFSNADIKYNNTNEPPTDLYYACLDSKNILQQKDLTPDLYLGRWPVNNNAELNTIIQKTIDTELSLSTIQRQQRSVILLAGGKKSKSGDGTKQFNKNITYLRDKVINPLSYKSNVIREIDGGYSNLYYTTLDDMSPFMTVYRGHGSPQGWENPLYIDRFKSENSRYYQFVFSFTCNTNTLTSYSFGKAMIAQKDGVVTHFGSTIASNRTSNNKSAKRVIGYMLDNNYLHIAQMTVGGMTKYYNAAPYYYMRKRQMKKYILYGDPSLFIYGIDNATGNPIQYIQQKANETIQKADPFIINDNNIEILIKGDSKIRATIFTISGNAIISSDKNNIDISNLPTGIYIIRVNKGTEVYVHKWFHLNKVL